jgi:2-keto-4-pentenoate hydratase/2-oxohepta-3-ene-1,7-dioic acid hydratase in catechol pathway
MKLVQFSTQEVKRHAGVLQGQQVIDVHDLLPAIGMDPALAQRYFESGIAVRSHGWMRWLQAGPVGRAHFQPQLQQALTDANRRVYPVAEVRLHAPIDRPGKIIEIGRNYADHAKETGVAAFEKPRIVFKMPSSICDPEALVPIPHDIVKMDFEAELVVMIGDFVHKSPEIDALRHVAGYAALNDLSARELQFDINPAQTTFAKSMDGFCPLGPYMVTPDEVPDPQALDIECWVNGQRMQQANTHDMIFSVARLIHYTSHYMTLEPGDLIATGTPAGVGAFRQPPVWLRAGDRVEVSVQGLGTLRTYIADRDDD